MTRHVPTWELIKLAPFYNELSGQWDERSQPVAKEYRPFTAEEIEQHEKQEGCKLWHVESSEIDI